MIYILTEIRRKEIQIRICRGDEECKDRMKLATGSLLMGRYISDWTYSPIGRSEMKKSGIELCMTSYETRRAENLEKSDKYLT